MLGSRRAIRAFACALFNLFVIVNGSEIYSKEWSAAPAWEPRLKIGLEVVPVVKLRVRSGESIQEAVRRFRKLCERSGLRKEMRRKAYYEKPSERRRREELKRLRKARQAASRV